MNRWKLWASPTHPAQPVWLELVVKELSGLHGVHGNQAQIAVRWLGSHRNSLEKISTSTRLVQYNGAVTWWEGFQRKCKLKMADSQRFRPWIVDFEIRVIGSIPARTRLDISRFASDGVERTIGIPVKCVFRGFVADASLSISLRIYPRQSSGSIFPTISRGLSLRSSSSSDESRPSLWRALSLNAAKGKIRDMVFPEVDDERRVQTRTVPSVSLKEESGSMYETWAERTVTSRDGRMELETEIFFASIDQRSDTVAGESACSVIAVIIADWLHRNTKKLPLGRQFEYLIRQGSSEWRRLCADAANSEKFSDFHFDLDTVLNAKLRPLKLITENSYVGFFAMPGQEEELMSFDLMWEKIVSSETKEERVYIAGWNDHFFVLKVEKETIYLVDTLGERLFEGCNQAYILKFDGSSRVYARDGEGGGKRMEMLCSGLDSCKEFIKGFLAAVPLRELAAEMESGWTLEDRLHRLLQIEFHYTSPL